MKLDYAAIGQAITLQRDELDITWEALDRRSGVSAKRIQDIAAQRIPPYPKTSTLRAISRALDWPEDTLERIGRGELPPDRTFNQRVSDLEEQVHAQGETLRRLSADLARILDQRVD